MAEKKPQNFGNHVRWDPLFHFFMGPVFILLWITSIVMLVRHANWFSVAHVVITSAALVAVFKIRLYALKVQDRVIQLEERLRLASLLPEGQRPLIGQLTEAQLVGLRFASDEEAAALAQRAVAEKLSRDDIKKAIKVWRPDYSRV